MLFVGVILFYILRYHDNKHQAKEKHAPSYSDHYIPNREEELLRCSAIYNLFQITFRAYHTHFSIPLSFKLRSSGHVVT